jgi:hypothetical protein
VRAADRAIVLAHLEIVERYIEKGHQYIGRLQEIIDLLGRERPETTATKELLLKIEATQEMYVSHRDWLLKELKDPN